jgi:hypothetical protein
MIDNIVELIKSGQQSNVLLAEQLCVGAKLDFDGLIEEMLDLRFWMENLDDIPQTSKSEAACFLLTQTVIDLSNKGLSALPESIGNLQNLQELDLSGNVLYSLPESIVKLQNLEWLHLGYNNLSSLLESIGNLQNLQELWLYNNNLSSLPESIGNLQNLERLDLFKNKLSSLPKSIGNLQNLQILGLENNTISSSEIVFIKTMLPNCEIR